MLSIDKGALVHLLRCSSRACSIGQGMLNAAPLHTQTKQVFQNSGNVFFFSSRLGCKLHSESLLDSINPVGIFV